jgi:arginine N-succinyltransferase
MRMLENEGFAFENYVDIFDGGPTMTARTDRVRTITDAREASVIAIDSEGGVEALVATGTLADFRCAFGRVRDIGNGIAVSSDCAAALAIAEDATVMHVPRL